jgi:hypothetical protein
VSAENFLISSKAAAFLISNCIFNLIFCIKRQLQLIRGDVAKKYRCFLSENAFNKKIVKKF